MCGVVGRAWDKGADQAPWAEVEAKRGVALLVFRPGG